MDRDCYVCIQDTQQQRYSLERDGTTWGLVNTCVGVLKIPIPDCLVFFGEMLPGRHHPYPILVQLVGNLST